MIKKNSSNHNDFYFLSGGGEMGELIRATDWNNTPLGKPVDWPQSLRTLVAMVIENPFGMYIAWGKEYIQLYNDGYRPILGSTKHPHALGISTKETFAESWHVIGPMFDGVMEGKPVGFPDFMLELNRNGYLEECYFDFSYSPIRKDDGTVGGVLVTIIETTNRKKIQDALKESEVQHCLAIEGGEFGTFDYYPLMDKLVWSAKTKELFGLQQDSDISSEVYMNAIHPEDRKNSEKIMQQEVLLKNGGLYELEYRVRGINDGKLRWIRSKGKVTYDNEGKPVRYTGVTQEITERKEIEQALKNSEERFRAMADNIPNLAWMADAEGWIFWYNKKWFDYTGTKSEQMEGWGWQSVHDPEVLPKVLVKWQESIATGAPFEMVFPLKGKDGNFRQFLTRVLPVRNNHNKIYQWFGTNTDITEQIEIEKKLKQSEENLREIILHAPVAMCLFKGRNHVVELANERMFELWGRPTQEILNRPIFEGLPESKNQGLEAIINEVYTTGKRFSANGVPITLPRNGTVETVFLNFVYEAYYEKKGKVSGIIAVAVDVTPQTVARQKIEEVVAERTKDLENANNDLAKSNAELAQFAYIASHDLQEPLRKISTFTNMLENKIVNNLDNDSLTYLHKIQSSSARMISLIRDVLAYSELNKGVEIFTDVNLEEVITDVATDFELLIEQKQATIEIESLPVIPAISLQMTQLFANLLGNSLKFSKKEIKPYIKISAAKLSSKEKNNSGLDKSLNYIKIQFTDNGIGFRKEHTDQIFQIFKRLHGKSDYEGTGIGLALCKRIALNHGGDINALGSSENGAVFNIILPLKNIN